MSFISRWLLFIIRNFADIQFRRDFVIGTFFYTPCIFRIGITIAIILCLRKKERVY